MTLLMPQIQGLQAGVQKSWAQIKADAVAQRQREQMRGEAQLSPQASPAPAQSAPSSSSSPPMSSWEQIKQDSATLWSSDASPSATPRSTASQPSGDRSVPGPALSWPRTQPGVRGGGGTLGPSRVPGTQVKIPPVCACAYACMRVHVCVCVAMWVLGRWNVSVCVCAHTVLPGVWRGVVQGPGCGVQTTKKYKVGKTCAAHKSQVVLVVS